MPGLNLLADALTRSAEAPAVMQSFPALTATAVATLSAAVVLSPVAVNQAVQARVAESKARSEVSRQYLGKQGLAGSLRAEIPPLTSEASAAAASTETAEAPVTPGASAIADADADGTQTEVAMGTAAGNTTPNHSSSTTHTDAPSGKGDEATTKPDADTGPKPPKNEQPPASNPTPEADSPAEAKPEPPAVAGSDGWGSLPADAEFEAPESANQ